MANVALMKRQEKQQGVALVIALVLVLVSTLLGISAMQTSDIETQLANNTRFHQASFRVAESAAESLVTLPNIVTLANDPTASVSSTSSIEDGVSVVADFQPLGDSPVSGYSLGGQNGFRTLKFVSTATATIDAVESTSQVVQGAARLINSVEN